MHSHEDDVDTAASPPLPRAYPYDVPPIRRSSHPSGDEGPSASAAPSSPPTSPSATTAATAASTVGSSRSLLEDSGTTGGGRSLSNARNCTATNVPPSHSHHHHHDGTAQHFAVQEHHHAPHTVLERVCDKLRESLEFTRVLRAAMLRLSDANPMDSAPIDGLCSVIEQIIVSSIDAIDGHLQLPEPSRSPSGGVGNNGSDAHEATRGTAALVGGLVGSGGLATATHANSVFESVARSATAASNPDSEMTTFSASQSSSRPPRSSFMSSNPTLRGPGAPATFDHVGDETISQWLNENFAQQQRKKRTGFEAKPHITRVGGSQPQRGGVLPSTLESPSAGKGSGAVKVASSAHTNKPPLVAVLPASDHSGGNDTTAASTGKLAAVADAAAADRERDLLHASRSTAAPHPCDMSQDSLHDAESATLTPHEQAPAATVSEGGGPPHPPANHPTNAMAATSPGAASLAAADSDSPRVAVPFGAPRVNAAKKVAFTRTSQRTFSSVSSHMQTALLLKRCKVPMMIDVDSPDFDVFAAFERFGNDVLVNVAMNVFARYNFMSTLSLNGQRLKHYFEVVASLYRDENPYHNKLHAADVLQTVHVFLIVNDMRENFSDVELLAVLFAAVTHDVGHLGISNAFLTKVRHPLARLTNDTSVLESCHAALGLAIIEAPDCNFFVNNSGSSASFSSSPRGQPSSSSSSYPAPMGSPGSDDDLTVMPAMTREMFDDFRSLTIHCILGTDMKVHADHCNIMKGIFEDNLIVDNEIPMLLRSIVHVADIANPMKPYPLYIKWLERVLSEFWMQGDEERSRGLPLSPLCDRNTTVVGKAQGGFIQFVVKPFVDEIQAIMPAVWVERLNDNARRMTMMEKDEEVEILRRIRETLGDRKWRDADPLKDPYCILGVMSRMCCAEGSVIQHGDWSLMAPECFAEVPSLMPPLTVPTDAMKDDSRDKEDSSLTTATGAKAATRTPPDETVRPVASGTLLPSIPGLPPFRSPAAPPASMPNGLMPTPRTSRHRQQAYQRDCAQNLLQALPTPAWMQRLQNH